MSNKTQIINRQIAFMEYMLGTNYSQSSRLKAYKGGSVDCSSLEWASWIFAGFPLLSAAGGELTYAAAQMQAAGFNVLFTSATTPAATGLATTYGAQKGDIFGYSFSKNGRYLNCSHIASVYDGGNIIHTANNNEKCCKRALTWGAGRIIRIQRLMDGATFYPYKGVKRGDTGLAVRAIQVNANFYCGTTLTMDGVAGSATEAAIKMLRARFGLSAGSTWSADDWKAIYGVASAQPGPAQPAQPALAVPTLSKLLKYTGSPYRYDAEVAMAQERLKKHHAYAGNIDGKFGPATKAAVIAFQKARLREGRNLGNSGADGVIGKLTWAILWE